MSSKKASTRVSKRTSKKASPVAAPVPEAVAEELKQGSAPEVVEEPTPEEPAEVVTTTDVIDAGVAPPPAEIATPRVPENLDAIRALAPGQIERANELRGRVGLPPAEFEFRVVAIDQVKPTQEGEDYDNPSSRELARHIGVFGASGREEDYAPLALDHAGWITDGNHRHCAYTLAGFSHVPALVPVATAVGAEAAVENPPLGDAHPADTPVEEAPAQLVKKARRGRKAVAKAEKQARGKKVKEKGLSALEAAVKVLAEEGTPLNCKEMVEKMEQKGYWSSPAGKTPQATLYSSILREIQVKGTQARFTKAERGRFAVNQGGSTPTEPVAPRTEARPAAAPTTEAAKTKTSRGKAVTPIAGKVVADSRPGPKSMSNCFRLAF